jgi:hypothetical protein
MQTQHQPLRGPQFMSTAMLHSLDHGVDHERTVDRAFSQGMVQSRGGVKVSFFYDRVECESANPAVNGTVQERLFVAKQPLGDRRTISITDITPEKAKRLYPMQYEAFVSYAEVTTAGTPLADLPGMTQSQIGLLVMNGITCIEDLSAIGEDTAGQLGREVAKGYQLAKSWVDKATVKGSSVAIAEERAVMIAERKAMTERLARQGKVMAEMQAKLDALQSMGVNSPQGQAAMSAAPAAAEVDAVQVDEEPTPLDGGEAFGSVDDDLMRDEDNPIA